MPAGVGLAEDVDRGEADDLAVRKSNEAELRPPARPPDLERSPLLEAGVVLGVEAGDVPARLQADGVHALLVPCAAGDDDNALRWLRRHERSGGEVQLETLLPLDLDEAAALDPRERVRVVLLHLDREAALAGRASMVPQRDQERRAGAASALMLDDRDVRVHELVLLRAGEAARVATAHRLSVTAREDVDGVRERRQRVTQAGKAGVSVRVDRVANSGELEQLVVGLRAQDGETCSGRCVHVKPPSKVE